MEFAPVDIKRIAQEAEKKRAEQAEQLKYNPIGKQREAEEQQRAVYNEHQANISKAGQLRASINIDIKQGEETYNILLKALECISLMTGDKLFYDANKERLQRLYRESGEINR